MTRPERERDPQGETGHVEAAVRRMAEMHAEYANDVTALQRRLTSLAAAMARPPVMLTALVGVLAWVGFNSAPAGLGLRPFDPPPFAVLQTIASVAALFMTLLILVSQRKEEELARRRAQLTLQLASLTEQKIAKVIGMLEEQRRENPLLPTREDPEANDMARSADPAEVLDRIIETHENAADERPSR